MSGPTAVPDFGPRERLPYRPLQGFLPAFTWGVRLAFGRTRRLVVVALLAGLVGYLVGTQGVGRGPLADRAADLWEALDVSLLQFVIPLVALVLVAGGFQREVTERTLVYHLVRPISRRTLFLARFLAGCVVAIPVAVVPVATAIAFSEVDVPLEVWRSVPLTVGLGVVATGAIYYLLAAALRFGTIAGLVYTFVIDAFIQGASGTMQKLSATFYVRSLHHRLTDDAFAERSERVAAQVASRARLGGSEMPDAGMLGPAARIDWVPEGEAVLTLLVITGVLLAVGLWVVSRRDYPLKD